MASLRDQRTKGQQIKVQKTKRQKDNKLKKEREEKGNLLKISKIQTKLDNLEQSLNISYPVFSVRYFDALLFLLSSSGF